MDRAWLMRLAGPDRLRGDRLRGRGLRRHAELGAGREGRPGERARLRDLAVADADLGRLGRVPRRRTGARTGTSSSSVRVPKGGLPLRTDGITISEEKLAPETAGGLEPAESGAVRDLSVQLRPGKYEVFCNMSGHFMAGMHAKLVVT